MKVTPVASPMDVKQVEPTNMKARAIEAFNKGQSSYDAAPAPTAPTTGQAQETPVQNPNKISAEELSAIRAPTKQAETQEAQITDNSTTSVASEEKAPVKDPAISRLYAQLSKQERQLRVKAQAQEQQFRQREAAITAREAEAAQKSELNQKGFVSVERLKSDILGVAAENGISYDEVAQQLMNPSKVDPRLQATIDALKAEIQILKKSTEEGKAEMTRQQNEAYTTAIQQIETDVRTLVATDPNFELIKANRAEKEVVKLIEKTYKEDKVLMTVEDASQEVEEYLYDKITKLANLNKVKRSLSQQTNNAGQAQKTAQTAETKGQDSAPGMKTLTNAASSTRKLSNRERAILAFEGKSRS